MDPLILDSYRNLAEAFYAIASSNPETLVYSQATINEQDPKGERVVESRNYSRVNERVLTIASHLRGLGVTKGSRVAVLSGTRPEWMEADLAIQSLGAVTVSIYQSVTAQDVGYILYDSEASLVIAENQEQVEKLKSIIADAIDIPATEARPASKVRVGLKRILTFEQCDPHPLVTWIADLPKITDLSIPREINGVTREDLAALVYTSGTTGPPKGVMQTHGNHLSNVRQAFQSELVNEKSSILLFLPLAHSFAKLMGYIGFLTPVLVKFPAITDRRTSKSNADSITRDMRELSAEVVPIVPRLLEKMEGGIRAKAIAGGLLGALIGLTIHSRRGGLVYLLMTPLRRSIRNKLFGPHFKYAVSGGAKLGTDTGKFFDHLQITVLQGYGLTETVVATNVNRVRNNRIGTVGPALAPDIQIRIAEDGEICFRGPNVAKGYLNRPEATAAAWDEQGWFHTGDLGALAEDGFLSITGRKKELIVTSNGKKIAPEIIEQRIKATCPLISQIIMYGEGRSYNIALVTINFEAAKPWALSQKIKIAKASEAPELRAALEQHIKKLNNELSNFEAIHGFIILDEEFTIENGLLTPTFKAKRNAVYKKYANEIDALYTKKEATS